MNSFNEASDWQMGVGGVLVLLLAVAVVADARHRRIPNVLVLVTLLFGLLFHALGPRGGAGGLFSSEPGALGGWLALAGAFTGLLLFLPFYPLRVLGAGDVKLMAAVGAFAGPAATVNLALIALLAGGVLALARLLLFPGRELVLANLVAILGQLRPGATGLGFDATTQTAWRMPYAVAIASGVVAYGAWTLSGRAPILIF